MPVSKNRARNQAYYQAYKARKLAEKASKDASESLAQSRTRRVKVQNRFPETYDYSVRKRRKRQSAATAIAPVAEKSAGNVPIQPATRRRTNPDIQLHMECEDEDLSPSQQRAIQRAWDEHHRAKTFIAQMQLQQQQQQLQQQQLQLQQLQQQQQPAVLTTTSIPSNTITLKIPPSEILRADKGGDVVLVGETPGTSIPASAVTSARPSQLSTILTSARPTLPNPTLATARPTQMKTILTSARPTQLTTLLTSARPPLPNPALATAKPTQPGPVYQYLSPGVMVPLNNQQKMYISTAVPRPLAPTQVPPRTLTTVVPSYQSSPAIRTQLMQKIVSGTPEMTGVRIPIRATLIHASAVPTGPRMSSPTMVFAASATPSSGRNTGTLASTDHSFARRPKSATADKGLPVGIVPLFPKEILIDANAPEGEGDGKSPQSSSSASEEKTSLPKLEAYYYGRKMGDGQYRARQGDFRFKCFACLKILTNNVKVMQHIQAHIDSERQQNLDLSDLTECRHCYRHFDTPFRMQCHVEVVHSKMANNYMCRICERHSSSLTTLASHLGQLHGRFDMPYVCMVCKFRTSVYSDLIDHFKSTHDGTDSVMCLHCLKMVKMKMGAKGYASTQMYYYHVRRHSSKTKNKRCPVCKLAFINPQELKVHRKKDHTTQSLRGVQPIRRPAGSPGRKAPIPIAPAPPLPPPAVPQQHPVPEVTSPNVKSLNVPAAITTQFFSKLVLPTVVHAHNCIECQGSMAAADHYRRHLECDQCRFATNCGYAFSMHLMEYHRGKTDRVALHIPPDRRQPFPFFCACGFSSRRGNALARHLLRCSKARLKEIRRQAGKGRRWREEEHPRNRPGASLLDVLGLVKKTPDIEYTVAPDHGSDDDLSVDTSATLSCPSGDEEALLRDTEEPAVRPRPRLLNRHPSSQRKEKDNESSLVISSVLGNASASFSVDQACTLQKSEMGLEGGEKTANTSSALDEKISDSSVDVKEREKDESANLLQDEESERSLTQVENSAVIQMIEGAVESLSSSEKKLEDVETVEEKFDQARKETGPSEVSTRESETRFAAMIKEVEELERNVSETERRPDEEMMVDGTEPEECSLVISSVWGNDISTHFAGFEAGGGEGGEEKVRDDENVDVTMDDSANLETKKAQGENDLTEKHDDTSVDAGGLHIKHEEEAKVDYDEKQEGTPVVAGGSQVEDEVKMEEDDALSEEAISLLSSDDEENPMEDADNEISGQADEHRGEPVKEETRDEDKSADGKKLDEKSSEVSESKDEEQKTAGSGTKEAAETREEPPSGRQLTDLSASSLSAPNPEVKEDSATEEAPKKDPSPFSTKPSSASPKSSEGDSKGDGEKRNMEKGVTEGEVKETSSSQSADSKAASATSSDIEQLSPTKCQETAAEKSPDAAKEAGRHRSESRSPQKSESDSSSTSQSRHQRDRDLQQRDRRHGNQSQERGNHRDRSRDRPSSSDGEGHGYDRSSSSLNPYDRRSYQDNKGDNYDRSSRHGNRD